MKLINHEEIKKALLSLENPWFSAAIASRIVGLYLPYLSQGIEEGKPFLWHIPEEKRNGYLLEILHNWHCAWSAAYFRDSEIGKYLPSIFYNSQNNTSSSFIKAIHSAAYASFHAAVARHLDAKAAASQAYEIMASDISSAASAAKSSEKAKKRSTAAAIRAADAAADAAVTVEVPGIHKYIEDYLISLRKKKVEDFLLSPFTNEQQRQQDVFLHQLRKFEHGFDYWADWCEDRFQCRPLDRRLTKKSCILSEELLRKSPADIINAYLKSLRNESGVVE
jgi:hypothetical protein